MSPQKKKIPEKLLLFVYIFITVGLLVGAVVFSVAHQQGYRIKGLSIQKTATLVMHVSEYGAWVFVGEKPVHKTSTPGEQITIQDTEPGQQLVTVIKDKYFPWAKRLKIESNSTLVLHPFLLKQNVEAREVTFENKNYLKVIQYFSNPTNTHQTAYQTEEHLIEATEAGVHISCLEAECVIPDIETPEPVTSVQPFRSNPNVVIYTTPTQMWVSELVAEKRIAYQIFEGVDIQIFTEEDYIFVKSNNRYFRISL